MISAVDMIDAIDLGGAAGGEPGQDQSGGGPEVAGHDGSAAQRFAALDDGARTFDFNVSAQTGQFTDMHEAGFEDTLGDDADAGSDRHEGHHLGLRISGKAGIW